MRMVWNIEKRAIGGTRHLGYTMDKQHWCIISRTGTGKGTWTAKVGFPDYSTTELPGFKTTKEARKAVEAL